MANRRFCYDERMNHDSPASAYQITIDGGNVDQRIDNFLITRLKGVPRSRIYRILRKGEVRVNRGRVKPGYRLQSGDKVRIPPLRTATGTGPAESSSHPGARRVKSAILYLDPSLLVIDKPAGVAVHGGSGIAYGVIELLRAALPEERFLELAHRLDRDTSGCLVIARRRSALRTLHQLLRGSGVEKRYLALLQGEWDGGQRVVDLPLRKNQLSSGERVVRVHPQGKRAVSIFRPLHRCRQATLAEIRLVTGRTHQIRVHAAHIGHPVAGDGKYGDPGFNRELRRRGLNRLFLHAASIGFRLTAQEPPIQVSAPLPAELVAVLRGLEIPPPP